MRELIQKLEVALLRRNPLLAKSLQPGLPVEKIKNALKRAGITGAIEPIIELYSWRNGTVLQGNSDALNLGFAPPIVTAYPMTEARKKALIRLGKKHGGDVWNTYEVYHFLELEKAILSLKGYKEYARHQPKMSILVGRFFPILWDGSNGQIALDIAPSGHNRVVAIQDQDDKPLREAYDSFEEFLKDAIQANENNELLTCIRTPKKHIEEPPNQPEPASGVTAPDTGANKKKIPTTENTLALRTDFSDESAWKSLCVVIQDPDNEFGANVDFVSDPKYDGLTADLLPSFLSEDSSLSFAFIIDRLALSHPDHPILVIDLHDKPGRTFRVIAAKIGIVENNLSIANMGFDEFANAVDQEGVFRGF